MFNSDLLNLRRWGALTCVIALSMVLAACGDDDETNNGTAANNGGVTDTGSADSGPDAGTDGGQDDGGQADGGSNDGGQDAGADASDTGGDDTGVTDEDTSVSAIEVAGAYDGEFGGTETITTDNWTITYPGSEAIVTAIIEFDNAENYAVTQNPDDAEFDPSKFNKNVWTEPAADGSFYYCTVTYGEDSAEAAANTDATADDTDLEGEGCGGFPWTKLTPQ